MKLAFFIFLLFFWADAFSACSHALTSPHITYVVGENNPPATNTVSITRTGNGKDCGFFFLTFSEGSSLTYNRRAANGVYTLNYNIYKNSDQTGILKDYGDITSNNETFYGPIIKNQTVTNNYYFALSPIDAMSPPRFGNYTDTLLVRSYGGTWGGSNTFETSYNLNITITVPKMIYLSMLSTGDTFDSAKTSKILDFGELELNEELGFDIKLISNAGYNLKISSANNGNLKHASAVSPNGLISYEFYVNNILKNLSSSAGSPVSVATATGLTPAGGATLPIRVKIGSVENKIEGDYEDVVTVTVETIE